VSAFVLFVDSPVGGVGSTPQAGMAKDALGSPRDVDMADAAGSAGNPAVGWMGA